MDDRRPAPELGGGELHPSELSLPPEEVASRLRHLGGLVFLDSSSAPALGCQISLVTARPTRLLKGSIHDESDHARLREALGKAPMAPDRPFPDSGLLGFIDFDGGFVFGDYSELLVFDHADEVWWESGNLSSQLAEKPSSDERPGRLNFEPDTPADSFLAAVDRAKEYIAAGDIYQVNIAHRFSADWPTEADPFAFYRVLREVSPVPHGAFIELDGHTVLSTSPECFLRISGSSITTRPIKGTRPRFRDPDLDQRSVYDLLTSPKEIAELVMITDLERNDLGKICEFGSVRTEEFLRLEQFEHVYHRVSSITGLLRAEVDQVAALASVYPGGSISGAPKRRALEIIHELEPLKRGLYTGAIGYLGRNGESGFNIAIRTAEIVDGKIRFHVGSGIVADSDTEAEYQETLHKAAGFFEAAMHGHDPAP